MKHKFLTAIFFVLIAGFLWMSCDKIDNPLIIIEEKDVPENIDDTVFFTDSVIVERKQVLLEDFTGHKCVNCPEAAMMAHDIAKANDHKLIIYNIHAGWYATPDQQGHYTADFICPTGTDLYNNFQVYANPSALIDRVEYNGTWVLGQNDWPTAIDLELAKENTVNLKLKNKYYPKLNTVKISTDITFLSEMPGKYKLVVYIVENHIIAPQKNNDPDIGPTPDWLDYEHRNVLRDAVNTTYGEYISASGDVVSGKTYSMDYFYKIDDAWVTANCNIIAYIGEYDESLNLINILQVAELGIKTE